MNRKYILLLGGDSEERLVSVASAQSMAEAIPQAKLWFWHHEGPIFELDYTTLIEHKSPFKNPLIPHTKPIFNTIKEAIESPQSKDHLFILAVHGGNSENGYLQKLLEDNNLPFTGSDSPSSERAFDKVATKKHLAATGIKLAAQLVIDNSQAAENTNKLSDFFLEHGATIVKPVCGGSSIGCFYLTSLDQAASIAQEIAHLPKQAFLTEKLIVGQELTIGVMTKGKETFALPCTEIRLDKHHNFDYQGKYLGRGVREITPAETLAKTAKRAQEIALLAHQSLGLFGYSRSDVIVAEDGIYFLEINTLPGLSKQSLIPQQLAILGISLKEFLNEQIQLSLQRSARSK